MAAPELVSVLVPAYNHARYVSECLEALRAQTYRPLELLIADDGSSDDTAAEIRSFLSRHADAFDRVEFRPSELNRGTAATLNDLLKHARGRYVFVNASDDRAAPHAIATLASVLDADRRTALAVGDNMIIDGEGRRVYWGPRQETLADESTATYRTFSEYLRRTNPAVFEARQFGKVATLYRANHVPNGKLFRRAAIERAGGWRTGTLEDWDLNFRLARRNRLRFVDEVLFAYRWHESNSIRDKQRIAALHIATDAVIARELRNPLVRLRVMSHPGNRDGMSLWSSLRSSPPSA